MFQDVIDKIVNTNDIININSSYHIDLDKPYETLEYVSSVDYDQKFTNNYNVLFRCKQVLYCGVLKKFKDDLLRRLINYTQLDDNKKDYHICSPETIEDILNLKYYFDTSKINDPSYIQDVKNAWTRSENEIKLCDKFYESVSEFGVNQSFPDYIIGLNKDTIKTETIKHEFTHENCRFDLKIKFLLQLHGPISRKLNNV